MDMYKEKSVLLMVENCRWEKLKEAHEEGK
jgi:hypothetical protein